MNIVKAAFVYDGASLTLRRIIVTDDPAGLAPHSIGLSNGEVYAEVNATTYKAITDPAALLTLIPGVTLVVPAPVNLGLALKP